MRCPSHYWKYSLGFNLVGLFAQTLELFNLHCPKDDLTLIDLKNDLRVTGIQVAGLSCIHTISPSILTPSKWQRFFKKIQQEQWQKIRTITRCGPAFFEKFLEDRKQMGSDKWSRKSMKYLQETGRVGLLGRREWSEGSLGQLTEWCMDQLPWALLAF